MKITRFLVSLLLIGGSMSVALPALAMTDDQVVSYIKSQAAAGKSEKQIGQELLAQGVTPEQVKRIKAKYDAQGSAAGGDGGAGVMTGAGRQRGSGVAVESGLNEADMVTYMTTSAASTSTTNRSSRNIYGHEIFNSEALTFEPNTNLATPQNYRLGPGDEVIIDLWGTNEEHIRDVLSPEGSIMIQQLGPVYLSGMTVKEAQKHVKNVFSKKYAGLDTNESSIDLTLGKVRSIQVDIMGEVSTPGTFRMSPFSSVFHALYNAGGINDIGSMRNIQVLRNGKRIADVDIYQYLFSGKQTGNIRLQEGDVIIVPPYSRLVNLTGNVKRPMYYEMKPGESLQTLIDYAGGFRGDAYSDNIRVQRQNGLDNELVTVEKAQFPTYSLRDGDVVSVGTVIDRYNNRVELRGAVNRPGQYAIGDEIKTLRELVNKAEGLAEEAYLDRALLYREKPDRTMEVIALNIGDIMSGKTADIALQKNDLITISDVRAVFEIGSVTIGGMVDNPGKYGYADGMTVEDLILAAGGLLDGASMARIDVARRINDPDALTTDNNIAKVFTFGLENGLAVGDGAEFQLQPYDIVTVRKSPAYQPQEQVSIRGQVPFEGGYTLQTRNERLSDLVKRAGGLLESAYVRGANLSRIMTEDQIKMRDEILRLARMNQDNYGDSISMSKLDLSNRTSVGIDLEKALENPGSSYDLVLQPGDQLMVPEMQSTVKVAGEVLFPNTVVYGDKMKLKNYIEMAGGYSDQAKKSKVFVVYMNGTVAKGKRNTPIEPGCTIIVPSKPEKKAFDWTKTLTIATSLGSLATMAASLATIFK